MKRNYQFLIVYAAEKLLKPSLLILFLCFAVMAWSQNYQNNITATSNWLASTSNPRVTLGDGAVVADSNSIHIMPYYSNIGVRGFTKNPTYYPNVKSWMDWYWANVGWPRVFTFNGQTINSYGAINDFTVSSTGTETAVPDPDSSGNLHPESTDSYAGTFLSLAYAYYQTGNPDAQAYINSILPPNSNRLDYLGEVIVQTKQSNGNNLTWARPDYNIEYLRDNCEAYRGLRDLASLYTLSGFTSQATFYNAHANQMLNGIQKALWDSTDGYYYWYTTDNGPVLNSTEPSTVNWNIWYPDSVSQIYPIAYGILQPTDPQAINLWRTFQSHWQSKWPTLSTGDQYPWAVVGYVAALMGDTSDANTYINSMQNTYVNTNFVGDASHFWSTREAGWFIQLNAAMQAQSVPRSNHVVLVVEENQQFTTVQSQMPWLTSMGNQYGYAANYQADTTGSLMDYLWLSSGSCESGSCAPSSVPPGGGNFGCTGGGCTSAITDDNIFRILSNAGIPWKEYMESYTGWNGPDTTLYVKKHNPAAWYSDVINSPTLQNQIVDFSNFATDVNNNNLPAYSIVVPNLQDDAHDGTPAQADAWLQNNIAPILNTPPFQPGGDGILIITFDECDGAAGGNCSSGLEHIYTAVIGPGVVRGTVSQTSYKHENTLRTILQALGRTDFPLASGSAAPMCDFFSTCGPLAANFDDTQTGWQLCTGPGCAGGTGTPTSTSQTFMHASPSLDGSSMLLSLSGPQLSNNGWFLDTGPQDSDTSFTLDLWFNVPSNADVQAVEFDMFQYLLAGHGGATANTRLFFGTECLTGNVWNVWDSSGRNWIDTGAPCNYIVSSTQFNHLVIAVHRVSGDTSCGGFPCMFYDSITLNGTAVVSNVKTNAGALPAGWSQQTGVFLQLDTNSACGSGCTINEYIDKGNLFAQ